MERQSSFVWEAEIFKTWEAASDELRLSTLIHYMQEYNVDKTYDNYILLTLAANGFLKIEYDHQVDETVLRHMEKENIWLKKEGDRVAKDKFGHSISIVHTVPANHPLLSFAECAKSHYVNNPTHSYDLYASKFEADFVLSYLMLLIGDKNLRENYRKIFLDIYQPKSNGALWEIPKKDWDELNLTPEIVYPAPATIKSNYGEWESFVVNFLDIKQGSVLDLYAGVGTLAMQLNLENVVYMANMQQLKEHDLMNMLFYTDSDFSNFLAKKQIQVFNDGLKGWEMNGLRGMSFDYIIANCCNERLNGRSHPNWVDVIDMLLSSKGKALEVCGYGDLFWIKINRYLHLFDAIILLEKHCVFLLNKNKECADIIKVYDRTAWLEFTADQLLESIREQENLHILTLEDINDMGGFFNIDAFKRKQYKIEDQSGYRPIKLGDLMECVSLEEDTSNEIKLLYHNIEGYAPLSPYVKASEGKYIEEMDEVYEDFLLMKRKHVLINQKILFIYCMAKDRYRPFIFNPSDGEAGISPYCKCFIVDEEKINIDYLVYQMNEEYFLKQLFPHEGNNRYNIRNNDILDCQILVPDVESSVERQKQIIEDLRQKEIAEIAQRYGFDLGKFVQYKASDLLKGTTLNKGKYTVEGVIGHGGFGKVYKARNEETGEIVAIKEFFYHSRQVRDPETNNVRTNFADIGYVDDAKEKFRREKAKIQECAHDNIVKVYEEFEENNTCYYSMEYIDGENLVNKKGIGEREALAIIRQVAEALKTMHKKRYNHSDVKPQNILLDSNGVATLIDFSGAHHYEDDEKEGLSITGNSIPMEIKTPGYTPDCAYKAKGFHAGRDIYSLGATLYYMLTGNSPATIDKQMKPDKISTGSWNAICCAMEEDPRIWLKSMDEFLALLPGDEEIGDIDVPEPTRKWRITPRPIVELKNDEVFVFGSNKAGHHSGGAAKQALKWGAKWYVASGPMGQTYGIPTVGVHGLDEIERHVQQFITYVEGNDHITFYVTAIGCGSAGFTPEQIAPLFKDCVDMSNVYLPESFWQVFMTKGFIRGEDYKVALRGNHTKQRGMQEGGDKKHDETTKKELERKEKRRSFRELVKAFKND